VRDDAQGAAVARARAISVGGLRRALSGDLDRMTMMALRPAAAERYASVEALASDLRRWLGGFPVLAAGSGRVYRARKFARRHRVSLLAAAAAATALATFATLAVLQARRAERQRLRAEAVTDLLVGAFSDADPERNRGTAVTAREVLDHGAKRLAKDTDARLAAELARVVGDVYVSLGLYGDAQPLLERAEREVERGGGDPAPYAAVQQGLAELCLAQARLAKAQEHVGKAVTGWRAAGQPEKALEAERLQARIESKSGRPAEAAARLERVLREQEAVEGPASEATLRTRLDLAQAEVLRGEPARAEAVLRAATRPADDAAPLAVALDEELARVLMRLHRSDEGEALARSALARHRSIWGARHPKVAGALTVVGGIAFARARYPEALAMYEEALAIRRERYGPQHPSLAGALHNVALTHMELRRPDLAEPIYREAVEICEAGDPAHPCPSLAAYLRGWGRSLAETERFAEAERQLDRARGLYVELTGDGSIDVAITDSERAGVIAATGRQEQAAALLRAALPALRAQYGPEHRITRRANERLKALVARGF